MRLLSFVSSGISRVQHKLEKAIDKITSTEDDISVEEIAGVRERDQVPETAERGLNRPIPESTSDSMDSTRERVARPTTLEPIEEVDSEYERSSILSSLRNSIASSTDSTISSSIASSATWSSGSSYVSSSYVSSSSSSILSRLSSSSGGSTSSSSTSSSSSSSSGFSFGSIGARSSSRLTFGSRSTLGLGSGLGKTFEKSQAFIWDFTSRRRFQEAAALHSILNPNIITGEAENRPMSLPTPPATPIYSATANFPVGDEDDVMSTITVSGNKSDTRELVDQFAFIAGAAAQKRKETVVKKDNGVAITGSYWGQEESWKEAERENMTAVCMERWNREGKDGKTENGVTFRVAMNSGVPLDVLEWLKGITKIMEQCARGERSELDSEDVLWNLVVEMNQRKIYDDIVKRFYEPVSRTGEAQNPLPTLTSRILPILKQYSAATGSKLLGEALTVRDGATSLTKLYKLCERIVEQGRKVEMRLLKELLIQCFHLRRSRTFRAFLFSFQDGYELFRTIQKLGRYRIATQALIDAIRGNPGQFNNVQVEPVQPPSAFDVNASIYPDADLKGYLRGLTNTWRITSISKESFEQIRGHFRNRCAELPVVHAEMQLVKYYEENQKEQQPTVMGCSKKPCQVCVRFLHLHGKFQVEKAHARISHRWALPNIRCKDSEATEKIGGILDTISKEMEDSLREIINLGPKEQPKQLREVSKSSTFLSPHDIIPIPSNAGTLKPTDPIQHASSFDSGFVDSSRSSFASFDGAEIKDWYGGLNGIASRNNSLQETPPPLHRLYHPPPPIPNSPPPLRRRRGSPGSLSEEYRIQETFGVRLRPVSLRTTGRGSGPLTEGALSPPPSCPPPPIPIFPAHELRERASSPTLGWNTRFPRHSIDSPETLRNSLVVPPTPPPEFVPPTPPEFVPPTPPPEFEGEEEAGPTQSIPNLQVYHGSQSSGLNEIIEEPQSQPINRPKTPLDPALIFFQNRSSRPRSTTSTHRSSAISPHRRPSQDSHGRRLSKESQSGSDLSPPLTPVQNDEPKGNTSNPNLLHNQPYPDTGTESKRNSIERKTVDVEIIDSTSPHRNVVYDIDDIGRLPTPPHNLYSHFQDRPHSPGRGRAPKSPLFPSHSGQRLRHTPPANIPHIVISSTSHSIHQHNSHKRPPAESPDSSYLSATTPPSSSSSSNSLSSSAYTPSLSRRHNRLRLPPTGSPSPPLTPPHYPASTHDPDPPESTLSGTSASFSSCSYFTNSTASYFSGSSGSYLSSSSYHSAATATSHIAIPMEDALSSLEREVESTLREAYNRSSSTNHRRNRDPGGGGGGGGGGGSSHHNHNRRHHGARQSSHVSSALPPVPEPPGMKSFLLRAVNKQQQQRHPAGGGESVSWISLDISEDVLRGSERFEVTAQLLDPDKSTRNRRRDRTRGGTEDIDRGGGGGGLVLNHEYDRDTDRLVLDIDFGGAVLRLKIYW